MKQALIILTTLFYVLIPGMSFAAEATENETKVIASSENEKGLGADNRKESEILLHLEKPQKAEGEGTNVFRLIFTTAILGVVGLGAFYFIKKYQVPKGSKHQTQIKVLQQHYLGPKKSLAIIRVAGESILIGVTDHNISLIKNLSLLDDEVPEATSQNFQATLGGMNPADTEEEFAMTGIKDIVSKRLKGMRSL